MTTLIDFLSGAVTMGFLVAGLFFLRFWRRTHDPLFVAFALAFALLGLTQALLTFADIPVEERSWLFLVRLLAFALILGSVWAKNRKA
jgi:hypothetical protein